ncbi:hypothetical protein EYB25_005469 [Talaromyces marneffei]|nr:hypothetical protein EYB25_005469 [Talaromyces marneffei]
MTPSCLVSFLVWDFIQANLHLKRIHQHARVPNTITIKDESTPVTNMPTPPRTARNKRNSTSATDTPTPPTTTPSKHSSTSAMNTPTMIDHNSAPRRSSRNPTPKATPLPVNNRAVHSLELTPHLLLQSDLVVKALESSLNGSRA